MAWKKINDTKLTAIADAIRGKTGGTEGLTLDQMPTEIAAIETGGGMNIETCTVTISGARYRTLCYTQYKDGVLKSVWERDTGQTYVTPKVCENVVCGTSFIIKRPIGTWLLTSISGGVTDGHGNTDVRVFDEASFDVSKLYLLFNAPSTAGAEGSIVFEED